MNSLVAQQQGYTFPMDEIPRTYYPGRGFLTDQEAYPENPFYRSPRYSGGDPNLGNTAGMFNLPYYGGPMNPTPMPYYAGQDYGGVELLAGGLNHQINEGAKNRKIRNIRNLKEGTSGPEKDAAQQMLKRLGGPQLPLAQGLPMGFQNKYVS